MSTTLRIYEQTVNYNENSRRIETFTEIACIESSKLIEEIREEGQKHWYISSECGAEFELLGDEVLEFAEEIKKYDEDFNDNAIDINEWYSCKLSY